MRFSVMLLILGISSASYAMSNDQEDGDLGRATSRQVNPDYGSPTATEQKKNGVRIKTELEGKLDTPIGYKAKIKINVNIEKVEKPCIIL